MNAKLWSAIVLLMVLSSCGGDDGGPGVTDTGVADTAESDAGDSDVSEADVVDEDAVDAADEDVADDADTADTTPLTAEDVICRTCTDNASCEADGALCIRLPTGGSYCGWDCSTDPGACPDGTSCFDVSDDGSQSQCLPDNLLCVDRCAEVTCAEGWVCDPQDGACNRALELCDPCTNSAQCGGATDLCLTFPDGELGCATDCAADPAGCPDGFTCSGVNSGTETLQVCVPENLTCVDRCTGVTCDEGQSCDPFTGACIAPGGMCDPCSTSDQCGGALDRCLGLAGPPCETNADCASEEVCDADSGTCVGGFCGLDCSAGQSCPDGAGCFNFAGGEQCLPIRLDCLDRCADVVCEAGFNCDDLSGECVRSEVSACGAPCDSSAECGGYEDLCLTVTTGRQCYYSCEADQPPCPIGYGCFTVFSGGRFCLPSTGDSSCDACASVRCPEGEECVPFDGSCVPAATACRTDDECASGSLCNFFEGRCEPLGTACSYEERFFACESGVMACDAAAPERNGTCEQSCFSPLGCPPERSECVRYEGVAYSLCTSDAIGGAHTCGSLSTGRDGLGRACTPGEDPTDPALCPDALTDLCYQPGDAAVPAFCTLACDTDADCGDGACETFDDGAYCVPSECGCLRQPVLADGEIDVFGRLLDAAELSACAIAWSRAERRAGTSAVALDDPYRLLGLGGVLGDPLQAVNLFDAALAAMRDARADQVGALPSIALAAEAFGVLLPELTTPPALGADPLFTALSALQSDLGGAAPDESVRAAAAALPDDLEAAVAALVDTFVVALDLRASAFDGADPALLEQLFAEGHALVSAGTTTLTLDAPEVLELLADRDTRAAILAMGQELVAAIERFPRDVAGAGSATFRFDSDIGSIIIAGAAADVHAYTEPVALLIDLGGDDSYTYAAGANASVQAPIGIVIDLGGADTYGYDAVPVAEDAGLLPSDGAGRATPEPFGAGPVTLSTTARQGAGRLGFGALYDWGPGADTFRSLRMSQGFGLLGVGVLVDDGGEAELTLEAWGQGAGLFGVGVLAMGDAPHQVSGVHGVQGAGGVSGVGVLVGGAGGDAYTAAPGIEAGAVSGARLYDGPVALAEWNMSAAQGAGVGVALDGVHASGGVGVLLDVGGLDTYVAGLGAQGFAHQHGAGLLRDMRGDDTYRAVAFAQGAAVGFGSGSLLDFGGDDVAAGIAADGALDTTPELTPGVASGLGFGRDFAGGVFADFAGDDTYVAAGFSLGYGVLNGAGLFFELSGADTYSASSNDTFGRAVLTIDGSEPSTNPRRSIGTWGFFTDAGGVDSYARPDRLSPPIDDGLQWLQTSPSEATLPTFGGGIDADGATLLTR